MLPEKLLTELQKLTDTEKFRVVQMLVNELVLEDILTSKEYEVWSPFDAPGAAAILTQMLEET
ncbi:MAG: hypothetical protein GC204_00540 [Chloroflexi bacterium]|nr:hypothetical protein [Chloroflexota bacterium]